ncbi:MAG: putative Zn-dependent peptidase [Glaciecola sp.]
MTVSQTQLPSGVRIGTESIDSVRSAAVGMWIGVGSRDEAAHQAGCSHFLEHLLFKGTAARSALEIAYSLDEVGGELNAFTSKEVTCFYARVIDKDLRLATDVLGDMLVSASNTPEDFASEREVVLEEINIHLDTPDDLVHSDLSELILGEHPLALETLGSQESIRGMARDTVHEYYLEKYRPENLVVAVAGNVDHDEVVALVDEFIGDLGRPGGEAPKRSAPPIEDLGSVRVRHRPTEQVHIALGGIGMAMDDERRYAMRVLQTLLGGGMSSRLFQEIREIRGLAYTTYSYASMHTDVGQWGAYAGTTPSKLDQLLDVMIEQIDKLADSITVDEVRRAQGQLKGGTVLGLEDSGSRMNRIGKLITLGLPIISVDEILRRVDAVDLDDVRQVARDVLCAPRSLAVVGPFDESDTARFAARVS